MAKKIFYADLAGKDGIKILADINTGLESYYEELEGARIIEFTERMSEIGYQKAMARFRPYEEVRPSKDKSHRAFAGWKDQKLDAKIKKINPRKTASSQSKAGIKLIGEEAKYVEFGSGVHHNAERMEKYGGYGSGLVSKHPRLKEGVSPIAKYSRYGNSVSKGAYWYYAKKAVRRATTLTAGQSKFDYVRGERRYTLDREGKTTFDGFHTGWIFKRKEGRDGGGDSFFTKGMKPNRPLEVAYNEMVKKAPSVAKEVFGRNVFRGKYR